MKRFSAFARTLYWLNWPAAALIALLQRTPLLRMAGGAADVLTAPRLGAVVRSAFATTASLGAVHALAGATQFSFNRASPISGTVGVGLAPLGISVIGAQHPAGSFRVTNLPPGLSVSGANASGVVTASSIMITGTPSSSGTYTTTILAYELPNAVGDIFGPTSVVFNIAPGAAVAPGFTLQPATQAVGIGASVSFAVAVSGSPAPSLQWRRNNASITGATGPALTLTNVQTSDAGEYSVVLTNSAGSVTSSPATLRVSAIDPGARLANLSVRTTLAANQTLIVGVVVNDGSRNILVRAAGPALQEFGLTSAMNDPRLELFNGDEMVLANNDWADALEPTFQSVGAFKFAQRQQGCGVRREPECGVFNPGARAHRRCCPGRGLRHGGRDGRPARQCIGAQPRRHRR